MTTTVVKTRMELGVGVLSSKAFAVSKQVSFRDDLWKCLRLEQVGRTLS